MFWPEKPEGDARHALSQAIHYLRRSLGAEVIEGRSPDGFEVVRDRLSCDATEFLDAVGRDDHAEALRLYKGDLLAGFFVDAAPAFEEWVEELRPWLRRKAAEAAWRLAESSAAQGPVSAAAYARQAAQLSLNDETAVRRLIELLDRVGDHAGALEVYERLAQRLASEYACEPSLETVQLIRCIRAARVSEPASAEAVSPRNTPAAAGVTA